MNDVSGVQVVACEYKGILTCNKLACVEKKMKAYLPTTTARSPLMVPGSDFCGSVAPISFLPYLMTPSPSHTYRNCTPAYARSTFCQCKHNFCREMTDVLTIASTGPELRKSHNPSKKGLSLRSW